MFPYDPCRFTRRVLVLIFGIIGIPWLVNLILKLKSGKITGNIEAFNMDIDQNIHSLDRIQIVLYTLLVLTQAYLLGAVLVTRWFLRKKGQRAPIYAGEQKDIPKGLVSFKVLMITFLVLLVPVGVQFALVKSEDESRGKILNVFFLVNSWFIYHLLIFFKSPVRKFVKRKMKAEKDEMDLKIRGWKIWWKKKRSISVETSQNLPAPVSARPRVYQTVSSSAGSLIGVQPSHVNLQARVDGRHIGSQSAVSGVAGNLGITSADIHLFSSQASNRDVNNVFYNSENESVNLPSARIYYVRPVVHQQDPN
ncbi:uncharacterized protein LOC111716753 isoform X2 [Eurytemora carolleeae]|nr:uncharacterized protein LOC111716753 isoform X2 [Eurytemora carolleeae]|eukprot:XP_023347998.1 uncharacterized protein LOC111716753 isoform X2 [Eurytemora affinis]